YGLDDMWERLGFRPLSEKPGRNLQGLPLTHWWKPFAHASLFEWRPDEQRISFAIDNNVFIDLHMDRDSSSATRDCFPDWLSQKIELVITDETLLEINKTQQSSLRSLLRDATNKY